MNVNERYNEKKFINQLNVLENKVDNFKKQLELLSPIKIIYDSTIKLDNLSNKLNDCYNNIITNNDIKINHYIDKLIILNPLNLMKKGYAVAYKDDKVITTVNNININDDINIKFQDGLIKTKVIEKSN